MPNDRPSTGRLEAFSDGVIAVIVTIMVLELKVPHARGVAGLQEVLPILLIYLLSFTFVSVYWINHHELVRRIEHVDARVLYSNLLFLFFLSLLPFFTSWVIERELDSTSVFLYGLSLLVIGFSYLLLRLSVERRQREDGTHTHTDLAERRKHWLSLVLYLVAIGLALTRHPVPALLCDALVTVVWILPSFGTRALQHTRSEERPGRVA